jgi:glycosyltransferase involved in cell wall biosynthesis
VNWLITVARNNLELTQRAVQTFRAQDLIGGVEVLVINNASTDGTAQWLHTSKGVFQIQMASPHSVAHCWNEGLGWVFGAGEGHAMVVNNDVELRPDTYRWLLGDGGGFVTAVGNEDPDCLVVGPQGFPDPSKNNRPHPDFSCYLIRRKVWEEVGPFDEQFEVAFYEDNCYHLRMHRAGIEAHCIDLPFYHVGSATINNADDEERDRIQAAAAQNKVRFRTKYGFDAGSPEYYAAFGHGSPEEET